MRPSRRVVSVGLVAAIVLVAVVVLQRGETAPLDVVENGIGQACGDVMRDGQMLLVATLDGDDQTVDCLPVLRAALVGAGVLEAEADAALRQESGPKRFAGLQVHRDSIEIDGTNDGLTYVQVLDCRRNLIPLDRRSWSTGPPWDRILASPCDDAPIEFIDYHVGPGRSAGDD